VVVPIIVMPVMMMVVVSAVRVAVMIRPPVLARLAGFPRMSVHGIATRVCVPEQRRHQASRQHDRSQEKAGAGSEA
jgi:hypothetical protein